MENMKTFARRISDFCVGMEGNISCKIESGIAIKASGSMLSMLEESDIVDFDLNGEQSSNFSRRGSMELGFHMYLMHFEGINFISHTHPSNTLKILCSDYFDDFAEKRLFPDQVVFNGKKSCVVPYAKPGDELTYAVRNSVEKFMILEGYFPKIILLRNHGIIACGKTIDECVIATQICEKAAESFIGASTLGGPIFLTDDEVDDLLGDKNEKHRHNLLK